MVSSKLMFVSPGLDAKAAPVTVTPAGIAAAPTQLSEETTVSLRIVKVPLVPQFTGPSAAALATVGEMARRDEIRAVTTAKERLIERLEYIGRTSLLCGHALDDFGHVSEVKGNRPVT
jgi:hypothetical protein